MTSIFRMVGLAAWLGVLSAAPAEEPNVKDILTKVDTTTRALKTVSYKAQGWRENDGKEMGGRISGTVQLKRTGEELPQFRAEVEVKSPEGKVADDLVLVHDGKEFLRIDKAAKKFTRAKSLDSFQSFGMFRPIFMQEYTHEKPFSDELNADSSKYEGKKTVAGVECHMIHIVYAGAQQEARWYFGVADNLPHRVDRTDKRGGAGASSVLEVSDLKTDPALDAKTFALEGPAGYEDANPGLLSAGQAAPAFTLQTSDGKSISLAELKGKIVVLNFWKSWVKPSNVWLATVQKIHEKNKDRNVVVLGANVDEDADLDIAAFAKEKNISFTMLKSAKDVATQYRATVPTTYVIGPDGKVLHAMAKFKPEDSESELELTRAIEKALGTKP